MIEKLKEVEERYEEINEQLLEPEIVSDNALYRDLMREYKNLTPIIDKYREYCKAKADNDEAKLLLEDSGGDRELKDMAQLEYESSKDAIERIEEELKFLLLPRDDNDDKNVIVEIRGGAGGEEAALFAASLYRMYSMYGESKRWKSEILGANETELGGYKEISFLIAGEGAYSRLKFESGVHRVQRVPETETQGRIHTSTVTVAVLPEAEEVELAIDPKELQIDAFRSSGAGG
ncbi:MAG: PCRF domain-containing protein, partial [Oscillospiraceae bacterium]